MKSEQREFTAGNIKNLFKTGIKQHRHSCNGALRKAKKKRFNFAPEGKHLNYNRKIFFHRKKLSDYGTHNNQFTYSSTRTSQRRALSCIYQSKRTRRRRKHRAFGYSDGELIPIENPSRITLAELKGYTLEKRTIESNILSFLHGLPYGNMLLYGDRGTGKSSTVHAMLNRYFESGLRIVELNKENMLDLPKLRQILSSNPLRFIIFIDDLSLNEGDDKISGLKAALEGSVAGKTDNTMIVATSNRRHIVKESLSDRENSVHVNDSLQEQLSLSDRFGITVLFSSTGKAEYLSIVAGLCADYKIEYNEHIADLAERWALSKGGRSPRRARQFADLALSCIKKHEEIDF